MDPKAEVLIREATPDDCEVLLDLCQEIAEFHMKHMNLTFCPRVSQEELRKVAFVETNPTMGFYVAEVEGKVVGYAHYTYSYTMRRGRHMELQDLYVQESYRNKKIGDKLLRRVCQKAIEDDVSKMDFVVASWNPATNFYKRKGAHNVTEEDRFHLYRYDKKTMQNIASDCESDR